MGTFETFDHTADVGLTVHGDDLANLLATAARAVFEQMLVDWPDQVETMEEVRILPPADLRGDAGELLVCWLQELLFRFETGHWVPLRFDFAVAQVGEVRARVGLGRFRPDRHRTRREVKAVTYHDIDVHREADGTWFARFIVDV